MNKNNFFKKKTDYLTLEKIIEITSSKLYEKADLNQKIYDISTLQNAKNNHISFLNSGKYVNDLINSNAGYCLMEEKFLEKKPKNLIALINPNPYYAYAVLIDNFYEDNIDSDTSIANSVNIAKDAKIGKNVIIKSGAHIGSGAIIKDNSIIGYNSIINDKVIIGENSLIGNLVNISHAEIGKNALIHSGVKIGQDGFGFAHHQGINYKIKQLGMVIIGNDVEIGANSCIDRGAIENTIIHDGVKLDNLIQIAHNVEIGQGTVIAGSACIAGSTKVGKFCQIGGNAAISGHIKIADFSKIAGMSGVIKSTNISESVGGLPAVPIRDWHKITLKLLKIIKN
jgi:UDP-3-O-[3-hydroxymyristoyl] glucosamine N-acyltransferase